MAAGLIPGGLGAKRSWEDRQKRKMQKRLDEDQLARSALEQQRVAGLMAQDRFDLQEKQRQAELEEQNRKRNEAYSSALVGFEMGDAEPGERFYNEYIAKNPDEEVLGSRAGDHFEFVNNKGDARRLTKNQAIQMLMLFQNPKAMADAEKVATEHNNTVREIALRLQSKLAAQKDLADRRDVSTMLDHVLSTKRSDKKREHELIIADMRLEGIQADPNQFVFKTKHGDIYIEEFNELYKAYLYGRDWDKITPMSPMEFARKELKATNIEGDEASEEPTKGSSKPSQKAQQSGKTSQKQKDADLSGMTIAPTVISELIQ